MADRPIFPPAPWTDDDPLTSKDAQRLANAIEGVGRVVGHLSDRMERIEAGAVTRGPLSRIGHMSVSCNCGRQFFSMGNCDFERWDWSTFGRALAEHLAEHAGDGRYGYYYFSVNIGPK